MFVMCRQVVNKTASDCANLGWEYFGYNNSTVVLEVLGGQPSYLLAQKMRRLALAIVVDRSRR